MSQPATLTQEAASSSHRQNNHWQWKVAGSQVRWGIEATAIKSTGLQWSPFPFPYFVNSCCKTNFHKESKCDQKACVCIVFGRPEGKLWKSSLLRYYGAQKASWLGGLSRKEEAQFNKKRTFGGEKHLSVLFLMFEKFYFRLCLSRGRFYSFRMNKTGQTDHIFSIGRQGFSKWQILRLKKFPLYLCFIKSVRT